jgi:hypothetical protein
MKEVSVTFWEKDIDGESHEIMSYSAPFYPSYKIGGTIFLESTEHPYVDDKFKKGELKLTEFVISDIHHSVRQNLSNKLTVENNDGKQFSIPFSINHFVSMDVYVCKCEDEDEKRTN